MQTAVILGAGFSKAVANLPLTDDLGNELRKLVPRLLTRQSKLFQRGSFEALLSRLAEPQPDLDDVTNAENRALFTAATKALQEILLVHEDRALSRGMPTWLHHLVRSLHASQASVITFNYDTLLERAAVSSRCWDLTSNRPVNTESILRGLPPVLPGVVGDEEVNTFRLMKLHGSLDCYWVRGDSAGSTIVRLPGNRAWDTDTPSDYRHSRLAPGREPFIVPPASAKSAFYNNPITRQLWRDAAQALARADQVALVGYSLPLTDLVTAGMIGDALSGRDKPIHIVNPDPEPLRERLGALGIESRQLVTHSGANCVQTFASYLAVAEASRQFAALSAFPREAPLAIVDFHIGMHRVSAAQRVPGGVALTVDMSGPMRDLSAGGARENAARVGDVLKAREQGLGTGLFVADPASEDIIPVLAARDAGAGWVQLAPAQPLG